VCKHFNSKYLASMLNAALEMPSHTSPALLGNLTSFVFLISVRCATLCLLGSHGGRQGCMLGGRGIRKGTRHQGDFHFCTRPASLPSRFWPLLSQIVVLVLFSSGYAVRVPDHSTVKPRMCCPLHPHRLLPPGSWQVGKGQRYDPHPSFNRHLGRCLRREEAASHTASRLCGCPCLGADPNSGFSPRKHSTGCSVCRPACHAAARRCCLHREPAALARWEQALVPRRPFSPSERV